MSATATGCEMYGSPLSRRLRAGDAGARAHRRFGRAGGHSVGCEHGDGAPDVAAVALLAAEKAEHGYALDLIGCGGVIDGKTYHAFAQHGVKAMQYYSSVIYRGPLAAALIEQEIRS